MHFSTFGVSSVLEPLVTSGVSSKDENGSMLFELFIVLSSLDILVSLDGVSLVSALKLNISSIGKTSLRLGKGHS